MKTITIKRRSYEPKWRFGGRPELHILASTSPHGKAACGLIAGRIDSAGGEPGPICQRCLAVN